MTLWRLRLIAFAVPLVMFVPPAFGQTSAGPTVVGNEPTTDQRALAEMLFFTGKGMMGEGRFTEACPKFAESFRLDPAAGTLLNLAVCHEKEGKVASAWGEFRQAEADAKRANRADREALASEAVSRLEPELPFVSIIVPAAMRIPGLEVKRNGVPLQAAAWDTELPIDPGENVITASAPRYKTETLKVTLEKKQHTSVTLQPLEVDLLAIPPPPFWTARRKLGMGLLIPGIAVAGVGALFGGLALSEKSTSDSDCAPRLGVARCTQAGANAMSTAQTDAWVADFGIGVGAAAIIAGGLYVALGGEKQEMPGSVVVSPKPQASGWQVRFASGPHGGEGLLMHSF